MKNFHNFIIERINKPIMKYYAFDVDDNLLIMPTVIHMEHLVDGEWVLEDISTEKFAKIRNDNENWRLLSDISKLNMKLSDEYKEGTASYIEFRDYGPRGENAFLEDMKQAIETESFGPSWNKFIECLISGSIFAIITARGHESNTLRKGVEYIIENILTTEQKNEMASNLIAYKDMFIKNFDIMKEYGFNSLVSNYLDSCEFIGVSSPTFAKKYGGTVLNPEEAKKKALNDFINKINSYGEQIGAQVKLGFSDDDVKTVNNVKKYFNEINNLYNISFSVYNTSNPEDIIKNEIK